MFYKKIFINFALLVIEIMLIGTLIIDYEQYTFKLMEQCEGGTKFGWSRLGEA